MNQEEEIERAIENLPLFKLKNSNWEEVGIKNITYEDTLKTWITLWRFNDAGNAVIKGFGIY